MAFRRPSGQLGPPVIDTKVVSDFVPEEGFAALGEGAEAAAREVRTSRKRQAAWVAKATGDEKSEGWRAKKRPRTSAYQFARHLDNQVALGCDTGRPG